MPMTLRAFFPVFTLFVAASGFLHASGIPLDPADYNIVLDGSGASGPGNYADGTSTAVLALSPDPSELVSTNGGSASIEMTYYFTVNAAVSDVPVDLIVSAPQYLFINDAPLAQSAQWGATSQITMTAFDSNFNDYTYQFNSLDCFKIGGNTNTVCPDGFVQYTDSSFQFEVLTNEESRISMNVDVNFPNGGTAEAYVDPFISFDPSFDSTGYSLSFSDGISNAAPTPEPSTVMLLACGLLMFWMGRRRFARGRVLSLAGWFLAGSTAAMAAGSGLPAEDPFTSCVSGALGTAGGTDSCSQSDANGSDYLSLTLLPFAGLSSNATIAGGVIDSFSGFGVLNYSFEVVGGTPGDEVPLLISTNLLTSVSGGGGDGYAFSEILVSTALANNLGEVACTATSNGCLGAFPSDFSGTFTVDATSGTFDTVHLEIEASASPVQAFGESAFASADPLIYVDPSFADAADYSIIQSDGVGNGTSSTPEPGTLLLMCCTATLLLPARRCFRRA